MIFLQYVQSVTHHSLMNTILLQSLRRYDKSSVESRMIKINRNRCASILSFYSSPFPVQYLPDADPTTLTQNTILL